VLVIPTVYHLYLAIGLLLVFASIPTSNPPRKNRGFRSIPSSCLDRARRPNIPGQCLFFETGIK
jgi:hypothetical protein